MNFKLSGLKDVHFLWMIRFYKLQQTVNIYRVRNEEVMKRFEHSIQFFCIQAGGHSSWEGPQVIEWLKLLSTTVSQVFGSNPAEVHGDLSRFSDFPPIWHQICCPADEGLKFPGPDQLFPVLIDLPYNSPIEPN